MELDYHHQKLNVRIGSRVHARIKAKYLRTFLKILKKGAMYILVSNLSIKVLLYSVFCQDVFWRVALIKQIHCYSWSRLLSAFNFSRFKYVLNTDTVKTGIQSNVNVKNSYFQYFPKVKVPYFLFKSKFDTKYQLISISALFIKSTSTTSCNFINWCQYIL